jgi:pyridinium-3,5-biscarboxylic acid mononucleotide synthase
MPRARLPSPLDLGRCEDGVYDVALVDERALAALLDDVASGRTEVETAIERLRRLPFETVSDARLDHHRELRTGQAEAVYAPGKTLEQVRDAALALAEQASGAVFVTKATPEQFHSVLEVLPDATYRPRSGLIVTRAAAADTALGRVVIVAAGTSDLPFADEAAETAEAIGLDVTRVTDVGVAGLQRVLGAVPELERADVVVVVAGMDGALPSVVAGLIGRPVIAVPTSVGYGASFDGLAALLAMLNACAPGVTVVNIDNGFGAALAAHRILAIASHRHPLATA